MAPVVCDKGADAPRPASTQRGSILYCPPGTVLTGITGILPPQNDPAALAATFAGICGNPTAPAALTLRDRQAVPSCRIGWSIPREFGPVFSVAPVLVAPSSPLDACVMACDVASARLQSPFASHALAVLYTNNTCSCGRALTGSQLSATSLQELSGTPGITFELGRVGNVAAICAATGSFIRSTWSSKSYFLKLGLGNLGYSAKLTSIVRDAKYRLFTTPTDWEGAQRVCTLHGGHLATLEDPEDVADLAALLQRNLDPGELDNQAIWIGLHRAQAPTYRWVDGSPMTYPVVQIDEWDYAPPICGLMQLSSNWTSGYEVVTGQVMAGSCDRMQAFVCETSTIVDDSLEDLTPGVDFLSPLPLEMGSWTITLYRAHAVSWHDAARICRYEEKDLVWFANLREEDAFATWLAQFGLDSGIWTGVAEAAPGRFALWAQARTRCLAMGADPDGFWRYGSGFTPGPSATAWGVDEPNNAGGYEACGEARVSWSAFSTFYNNYGEDPAKYTESVVRYLFGDFFVLFMGNPYFTRNWFSMLQFSWDNRLTAAEREMWAR
ncbi:hypothetical protein HYH03_011719 [Edaphochlamys debaryana]|uniref:C-type lectin domain-containing protein n=1 Tax=Edaphochlamys debaryana TaxID=47281 RepID=A0A835XT39_9CHLO|nr:hypothetical protein HYH03_011719 [Edaphochlamys debaryana]|eukprot:KAG2489768.1 hypothetical protein HYH03_011719 [Edaphochlamys debaryana]